MAAGIITGRLLRKRNNGYLPKLITVLIWVLLFLLGVEVGGNETIVSEFSFLGFQAFILTIAGLAGSIFLSWILWRIIDKNKEEQR